MSDNGSTLGGRLCHGLFRERDSKQTHALNRTVVRAGQGLSNVGGLGFVLVNSPTLEVSCPRCGTRIATIGNGTVSSRPFAFGTLRGVAIRKRVLSAGRNLTGSFANVLGTAILSDGTSLAALNGGAGRGKSAIHFSCASCPGAVCVKRSSMQRKGFDFAFVMPGSVSCSGGRKGLGLCTSSRIGGRRTRKSFLGCVINNATSGTRTSAVNPRVQRVCLGSSDFMRNSRIGAAPCFITEL